MSLHYLVKLEMFIVHMLPLSCYRKKLQNLSNLNCVFQIRQIWIQLITACWKILQEKVYKTRITDLELLTTPLTNGWCNDDMIQLGPLRSQSLFQFVQIGDEYFVHLSGNTPTCCNRGPASISTNESDLRPVCGARRLSEILRYDRVPEMLLNKIKIIN